MLKLKTKKKKSIVKSSSSYAYKQGSDSSNCSPSSMSSSGIATTTTHSNSTENSPLGCDNLNSRHHTIENVELHDENNNKNSCNNNVSHVNHYQFNNNNSNNINNNSNNNNDHHTLQHTNSAKQYYNQWHQQRNDDKTDSTNGQMALDQLLASLAIENDIIDQHLAKLNGALPNGKLMTNQYQTDVTDNGKPLFTCPINRDNNFNRLPMNGILKSDNYQNTNRDGIHSNLNDVIANLTDFTRTESMRQRSVTNGHFNETHQNHQTHNYHSNHNNQNSHSNSNTQNNHVNSNNHSNSNNHTGNNHRSYQEPCNNAIKRLTSESEHSSSISPSLSERSNGVSWSDQVGSGYETRLFFTIHLKHFIQSQLVFFLNFIFVPH